MMHEADEGVTIATTDDARRSAAQTPSASPLARLVRPQVVRALAARAHTRTHTWYAMPMPANIASVAAREAVCACASSHHVCVHTGVVGLGRHCASRAHGQCRQQHACATRGRAPACPAHAPVLLSGAIPRHHAHAMRAQFADRYTRRTRRGGKGSHHSDPDRLAIAAARVPASAATPMQPAAHSRAPPEH